MIIYRYKLKIYPVPQKTPHQSQKVFWAFLFWALGLKRVLWRCCLLAESMQAAVPKHV